MTFRFDKDMANNRDFLKKDAMTGSEHTPAVNQSERRKHQ
jgi:hypothetical protein